MPVLADVVANQLLPIIQIDLPTRPFMPISRRPFRFWRGIQRCSTLVVMVRVAIVDEANVLHNINHIGAHLEDCTIHRRRISGQIDLAQRIKQVDLVKPKSLAGQELILLGAECTWRKPSKRDWSSK